MKHAYKLFLLFFIFSASRTFSQINTYLQNNPVWHVQLNAYSGSDCSGSSSSFNYYVNGDTVLYAQLYKKVYKKGIVTYLDAVCNPTGTYTFVDTVPCFYLRSLAKQMFILEPDDTTDQLLYDFNLVVGDTIPDTYTTTAGTYVPFIVAAIDSMNTPNGYLKRFTLNDTSGNHNGDTLYEGIGSTGGLVEPVFQLFLSGYHKLLCYALNSNSYIYSSGSTCDALSNITEPVNENAHIVFPNPFDKQTNFYFKRDLKNGVISLYNTNGVVVKTKIFSGSRFILEKEAMDRGVYFYRVTEGVVNIAAGKVVVLE